LLAASRALRLADIFDGPFQDATALLRSNVGNLDFCYMDPPYAPASDTANFTAYAGEFGPEQQQRLADELHGLKKRKVGFLLSNSDTRGTRSLYRGFTVESITARRSIACTGDREPAREILVSN
jgi:DNA adenine methylase